MTLASPIIVTSINGSFQLCSSAPLSNSSDVDFIETNFFGLLKFKSNIPIRILTVFKAKEPEPLKLDSIVGVSPIWNFMSVVSFIFGMIIG